MAEYPSIERQFEIEAVFDPNERGALSVRPTRPFRLLAVYVGNMRPEDVALFAVYGLRVGGREQLLCAGAATPLDRFAGRCFERCDSAIPPDGLIELEISNRGKLRAAVRLRLFGYERM